MARLRRRFRSPILETRHTGRDSAVGRLLRGDAAVDNEARAGHEGGIVRGKKDDAFGDVSRHSHTADRQALDNLPPSHLNIVGAEIARPSDEHLVAHIGVDCAPPRPTRLSQPATVGYISLSATQLWWERVNR